MIVHSGDHSTIFAAFDRIRFQMCKIWRFIYCSPRWQFHPRLGRRWPVQSQEPTSPLSAAKTLQWWKLPTTTKITNIRSVGKKLKLNSNCTFSSSPSYSPALICGIVFLQQVIIIVILLDLVYEKSCFKFECNFLWRWCTILYLYSRVDADPYRNTGTDSWNR